MISARSGGSLTQRPNSSIRIYERYSNSEVVQNSRFLSDLRLAKETGGRTCVTGMPDLVDLQEQDIAVAINPGFDQSLRVSGLLAFFPDLAAGPRPVCDMARRKRLFQGVAVHPGKHEHVTTVCALRDNRDQSVITKFNLRQKLLVREYFAHDAARILSNPVVRSAIRSSGSSRPACILITGPSAWNFEAVRRMSAGTARLS